VTDVADDDVEFDSLRDVLLHPVGAAGAAISGVASVLHLEFLVQFADLILSTAPTLFPAVWTAIKIGPLAGVDVGMLETVALVTGGVLLFKRLVSATSTISGKLRDRL
jgi:hypothetical protein